jgi:DNA-directed RNA polymerase alpha subunit
MAKHTERTHPNRAAFPPGLSGPALRALAAAGIGSVTDLVRWSEAEVSALHGMGPKALHALREALHQRGGAFRSR